ncbi:hypothetical protein JTB14_036347 [Gonioctena quinquepunctata]|nr:hypothetical protein JTB14_036347 [Gonioctena quinquepunctata]
MEGIWEANIKSLKSHLYRVIGSQLLTYEEFNTVLIQPEAVLNSRPLFPMSTDPNDLSGHFLSLELFTTIPDPYYTNIAINRLTRYQLLQRIHRDLWNRWHHEYLHTLQQRNKWTNPAQPV